MLRGIENKNIKKYFSNISTSRNVLEDQSEQYDLKYIMGLLNSRIVVYLMKFIGRGGIDMFPDDWKNIPIPALDDKSVPIKDKIVLLVNQMLGFQKQFHSTKNEGEKQTIKKQIDTIDAQINTLVYSLYALNETEIQIIETNPNER